MEKVAIEIAVEGRISKVELRNLLAAIPDEQLSKFAGVINRLVKDREEAVAAKIAAEKAQKEKIQKLIESAMAENIDLDLAAEAFSKKINKKSKAS